MRIIPLLAALAVALTTNAEAAGPNDVAIIGAGVLSCETWAANRRDGVAVAVDQWILGFLSGAAYQGPGPQVLNPLKGVDADAVWAWMDTYCRAHPIDRIADAGVAFIAAHPR
jgi:hypothetical protein